MEPTISNNPSPARVSPKDVFLHLLAIITLYGSAISLLVLLFQYINIGFPDPLEADFSWRTEGYYHAIRWAISALIILFPVYIISMFSLNKIYGRNPEKKNIWVRRWLVYLTLFVASLVIIGDLVSLIYNFLEGDLTMRFTLKILSVLLVAGSIFGYYFSEVKRNNLE